MVLDVTNPFTPAFVSGYSNGNANFYALSNYALKVYTAEGTIGIELLDFATPTTPLQLGYYKTNDFAADVFYYNNNVYVADGADGLIILYYSN